MADSNLNKTERKELDEREILLILERVLVKLEKINADVKIISRGYKNEIPTMANGR